MKLIEVKWYINEIYTFLFVIKNKGSDLRQLLYFLNYDEFPYP